MDPLFLSIRPPMMYRWRGDVLLDVHVPIGIGLEPSIPGRAALLANLGPTHLRCDLSFSTISSLFGFLGVSFALGVGWISLLQGSRGGKRYNVCIAWALLKYLGLVFSFFCLATAPAPSFLLILAGFYFLILAFFSPVYRF